MGKKGPTNWYKISDKIPQMGQSVIVWFPCYYNYEIISHWSGRNWKYLESCRLDDECEIEYWLPLPNNTSFNSPNYPPKEKPPKEWETREPEIIDAEGSPFDPKDVYEVNK